MLRPIPLRILKTAAVLTVPQKVERWGEVTPSTTNLSKTHLQASNAVKRTKDSREVVLRAILFYDTKNSLPRGVDFNALKTQADEAGGCMTLDIEGLTYTVETVEPIPDDRGGIHHYELGLV